MLRPEIKQGDMSSWLSVLERVVEHSANMVVVADADYRIQWVNPAFSRVTGWSVIECKGRKASEILHGPQTTEAARRRLRMKLDQGKTVSGEEIVNYRKNGESYTVRLNIEPIRDAEDRVVAYFSIQTDVSEQRRLEESEERLRKHLEVAQQLARIGTIEHDPTHRRLRWSSEVFRILGREEDTAPHDFQEFLRAVPETHRPGVERAVARSRETGRAFEAEFPVLSQQGQSRWVRCKGRMPHDTQGSGQAAPSTWMIQDVTADHVLMEERRQSNVRLNEMVRERTRELEEANLALEEFSHALSHDLKKPLRHMVSYSELARESLLADRSDAALLYCDKVIAAGGRLHQLVESMLKLSRLGRQAVTRQSVSMDALVADVLHEVRMQYPGRVIRVRGLKRFPVVQADPVLFREVWVNLIENALKYSADQVEVSLLFGSFERDDQIRMWIKDTGPGFDVSKSGMIFEMFGRADASAKVSGDGIGLALVRRIVESHGGRVWARSRPRHGATFIVALPKEDRTSVY